MLTPSKKMNSFSDRQSESLHDAAESATCAAMRVRVDIQLLKNPINHRTNRIPKQRTATLANRRQFHRGPSTHTRFIQFPHQKTVRQKHHVRVSGLTLVVPQLTISQSQFLLAVSVNGFRAAPATAIRLDDAFSVPKNSIRRHDLSRLGIVLRLPQDHDANLVVDIRHFDAHTQIPLLRAVARGHLLAILRRNRFRELDCLLLNAFEHDLAIEFQITDVAATRSVCIFQAIDVILNFMACVKTVEGERAEHAVFMTPVDQFDGKRRHLLELFARPFALVLFFEAAELQWITFAADRVHVVDEDQVLGVLVPLFRMVPERAGVLDELSGFVDEYVVQTDDAAFVKPGVVELLQPFDAGLVDGIDIPLDFGHEAVQTRLVGRIGHFACHSGDGFVLGNHQTGQIVGQMLALRLILKQRCEKLVDRVLNDLWRFDDRHGIPFPNGEYFFRRLPRRPERPFYHMGFNFAKV